MAKVYTKDPNAVLDYIVNWTDWLDGDTISTSTWTVGTGLTKDSDSKSSTAATAWLSGGTSGCTYSVSNRIVTAAGRTEDRTFYVTVKER